MKPNEGNRQWDGTGYIKDHTGPSNDGFKSWPGLTLTEILPLFRILEISGPKVPRSRAHSVCVCVSIS